MAENKDLLARIAQLEAQLSQAQNSRVTFRCKDGYMAVYGLPGKGGQSVSNTIAGWETLLGMTDTIKQQLDANRKTLSDGEAAYRASK